MSEHELIVLRPMPGSRFTLRMTVQGQDVYLEVQKKDLGECYVWLQTWLETCVRPAVIAQSEREAKRAAFEAEDSEAKKAAELKALLESIPQGPEYDPVRAEAERIKKQIGHMPEARQLSLEDAPKSVQNT